MADSKSPISWSQNGSDYFAAAAEMPKLKLDPEKATDKKATVAATVGFRRETGHGLDERDFPNGLLRRETPLKVVDG